MDKTYDHNQHEAGIYKRWEESGVLTAPSGADAKDKGLTPFTIIMPPPNANDPLHVGHAMFVTVEDILIRYHRMKGEATLWLPGTDHAGIETQFVFEKRLAKEGKSRFDFDRETLYKMIWDYVQDNMGTMEKQLKQLGASCDWTRFKFTLDPVIVKIVYKTFKKLYDDLVLLYKQYEEKQEMYNEMFKKEKEETDKEKEKEPEQKEYKKEEEKIEDTTINNEQENKKEEGIEEPKSEKEKTEK